MTKGLPQGGKSLLRNISLSFVDSIKKSHRADLSASQDLVQVIGMKCPGSTKASISGCMMSGAMST